jgi:hypothetical protein
MDIKAITNEVDRLHAAAKNGSVTIQYNGVKTKYNLTFTGRNYSVTRASDGESIGLEFNTRKLSVARQWLKEWFTN